MAQSSNSDNQTLSGLETEELEAWLRLLLTPGIGRSTARRLLVTFGSAQDIWRQPAESWRNVVSSSQAGQLGRRPESLEQQLARTIQWLSQSENNGDGSLRRLILTLGHPQYPACLLEKEDPPLLLHVEGRADLFNTPKPWFTYPASLAMVGSRSPSPQGVKTAQSLARQLAQAGWCIVSGLAHGIDASAHYGALEAAQPSTIRRPLTIAVVGTGLDIVYPRKHVNLAHQIAGHGMLISEYLLGTPPLAAHFPQRNRIISGLSQGTLVVEAALKSGSLITARLASEQGREVFAIPGSIHSPQSQGCHALLRQGAKLVENLSDILEELQNLPTPDAAPTRPEAASAPPPGKTDPLLQALGYGPQSLDELMARTGVSAAQLQARLLELELDGWIARMPGGLFQQIADT